MWCMEKGQKWVAVSGGVIVLQVVSSMLLGALQTLAALQVLHRNSCNHGADIACTSPIQGHA